MAKVVINTCYGGFGLSQAAYELLVEYGIPLVEEADYNYNKSERVIGKTGDRHYPYYSNWFKLHRDDNLLVRVVEELGKEANGPSAELKVVDINLTYYISDNDGIESVKAENNTWD